MTTSQWWFKEIEQWHGTRSVSLDAHQHLLTVKYTLLSYVSERYHKHFRSYKILAKVISKAIRNYSYWSRVMCTGTGYSVGLLIGWLIICYLQTINRKWATSIVFSNNVVCVTHMLDVTRQSYIKQLAAIMWNNCRVFEMTFLCLFNCKINNIWC